MSALIDRLPESLHRYAQEYAAQQGISVHQRISTALSDPCNVLKIPCVSLRLHLSRRLSVCSCRDTWRD